MCLHFVVPLRLEAVGVAAFRKVGCVTEVGVGEERRCVAVLEGGLHLAVGELVVLALRDAGTAGTSDAAAHRKREATHNNKDYDKNRVAVAVVLITVAEPRIPRTPRICTGQRRRRSAQRPPLHCPWRCRCCPTHCAARTPPPFTPKFCSAQRLYGCTALSVHCIDAEQNKGCHKRCEGGGGGHVRCGGVYLKVVWGRVVKNCGEGNKKFDLKYERPLVTVYRGWTPQPCGLTPIEVCI